MSRKWLVLTAVYIGGVTASINQFKVPPVMDLIVKDLNFSMNTAGWLMSSFALAGFLLALPAGVFIRTRHLKNLCIVGLSSLFIGGVLGFLAQGTTLMLVGRMFEGIGLLSMGMAGPTLISLWFPITERGLPLGIWTSWMPAGSIIMFNLAQALVGIGSWKTIWFFVSALSFFALIMVILLVRQPQEAEPKQDDIPISWTDIYQKVISKKSIWLLTVMFISYNFILSCYYSWAPIYLKEVFTFSPAKAAFTVSLIHLGIVPTTVVAGWVINKVQNYRYVYLAGFCALSIILLKAFTLTSSIIIYYMLILGIVSGFIPASVFAATPDVIEDKRYLAFAMSTILWAQNIGVLFGPSTVGKLLSLGVSWEGITFLLVPFAIVGVISGWLTK